MINPLFLVISVIFLIYGGLNYYIGLRVASLIQVCALLKFQSVLDGLFATILLLLIQSIQREISADGALRRVDANWGLLVSFYVVLFISDYCIRFTTIV